MHAYTVLLLVFAVVTNRATPPSHAASPFSHHVLPHRRGGPRRSARFRYAARGGHLSRLPFCLLCCHSTHHSSIGRQRVRHTTNHSLAHSPDLRGRMIGIGRHATEEPARRRRLSELLQWQLLMRGAPHIWDCGPPAPLSPLGRLIVVSSRLACVRGASFGQIPSGARAVNNNTACAAVVLLALSIGSAPIDLNTTGDEPQLPSMPRLVRRITRQWPSVTGRLTPRRVYHLPCLARPGKQATWKHVKAKAKPSRSCLSRPPHVANGAKHNADPPEILCESCLQPKLSILSIL